MLHQIIEWNDPRVKQPAGMSTILVVYENQVWSGVYAKDNVVLYPEDFGSVRLVDCELWAAWPKVPEPFKLESTSKGKSQ